jgi:hypothetical protein
MFGDEHVVEWKTTSQKKGLWYCSSNLYFEQISKLVKLVRPSPSKSKMIVKFVYHILSLLVLLSIFILLTNFEWRQLGRKFLSENSGKPAYDPAYDPGYYEWQIEQAKRKDLIQKTCAQNGSDLQTNVNKHWITFDKKDGLLYCRLNKVRKKEGDTKTRKHYRTQRHTNTYTQNSKVLIRISII